MLVTTSFGGLGRLQQLQHANAVAEDLVVDDLARRAALPRRGNARGATARKGAGRRPDRRRRRRAAAATTSAPGRAGQAAAAASAHDEPQTPSSVAASPRQERGHNLRESCVFFQASNEFQQPLGRIDGRVGAECHE